MFFNWNFNKYLSNIEKVKNMDNWWELKTFTTILLFFGIIYWILSNLRDEE